MNMKICLNFTILETGKYFFNSTSVFSAFVKIGRSEWGWVAFEKHWVVPQILELWSQCIHPTSTPNPTFIIFLMFTGVWPFAHWTPIIYYRALWGNIFKFKFRGVRQDTNLEFLVTNVLISVRLLRLGSIQNNGVIYIPFLSNDVQPSSRNQFLLFLSQNILIVIFCYCKKNLVFEITSQIPKARCWRNKHYTYSKSCIL